MSSDEIAKFSCRNLKKGLSELHWRHVITHIE